MNFPDGPDEKNKDLQEQLDSELSKIRQLAIDYGFNFSFSNLYEHIKAIFERSYLVRSGLSKPDTFLTMTEMEDMLSKLFARQHELNLQDLMEDMQNIKAESDLILKKKEQYQKKGVKIRKFKLYKTSVMTLYGRIHYKRMALIWSPIKKNQLISDSNSKKFIFPLDEALGLAHLPFKMTVPTMLEIARVSCLSDSFEDVEKNLRSNSHIIINDDTIRKIVNTIGSIVFNNDDRMSNKIWYENPPKTNKCLPKNLISPHALYLKIESIGIYSRTTNIKSEGNIDDNLDFSSNLDINNDSSASKEIKIGLAFSTDNFLPLKDKTSSEQNLILSKEYTAIIGTAQEFKKHLYSLAMRNGYGQYETTILLSDGSAWINTLKNELFDNVLQIIDFYHLSEKIYAFSKNVFGVNDSIYKEWADNLCYKIRQGSYESAVKDIESLGKRKVAKGKIDLAGYLLNNKDSLDYQRYLDRGFLIDSGAVKGASSAFMSRRMNLQGMRWSVQSGQGLAALMAKRQSGLWEKDVVEPVCRHYGVKRGGPSAAAQGAAAQDAAAPAL